MTTLDLVTKNYGEFFLRILPTGSRVICPDNVAPESDEDFLMLVSPDKYIDLELKLLDEGWLLGGSLSQGPELNSTHEFKDGRLDMSKVFHSYKSNGGTIQKESGCVVNLLLTLNKEYFEDFTRATYLAKALGLTNKRDRCILFKALCEDNWDFPEPEKEYKASMKFPTFIRPSGLASSIPVLPPLEFDDFEAPVPTAV